MFRFNGKEHDLGGGMIVRRVLPQRLKRKVGPFVFLDHMGPVEIAPEQNTDVRPHPHIGLSTLTYLFSGRLMHRDSLGTVSLIEPGGVNWMTAGRGISHSERAHQSDREHVHPLHGLQFWIALPDEKEDCDPSFQHYHRELIPKNQNKERELAVIAGEGFGLKSPVKVSSPLIFAEVKAHKKFILNLAEFKNFELAIYMVTGTARSQGEELEPLQMMFFEKNQVETIEVDTGAHLVVIGGEPMLTERHMWWNLVSSSLEKIERAKRQWKDGTFPMVPGETEFIPLPEK
jgi:hypothetical protein